MAADEFGQRVDDHVGPVLEGLEHERRRHGVVHDEWHPGRVGHLGHGFEVHDVAGRVADGFAEDGAGVLVDEGADRLGSVVVGEAGLDAQGGQHVGEVGEGCAVELRGHHDVRAGSCHRQDGVADGGHARGHHQGRRPPFEGADALLEDVESRVVEPVVVKARRLHVEHGTGVFGADEVMGHGLVNGHGNSARPVGCVAAVDGDGLVVHGLRRSSSEWWPTRWRTNAGPRLATARARGRRSRRRRSRPPGPGSARRQPPARAAGGVRPSPRR